MNATTFARKFAVIGIAVVGLGFAASTNNVAQARESTEMGGTEDINIGVGELQECVISKSMDIAGAGPDGGTFTLTFQGQTTTPGKGGNVEYEWKVEAGEKSERPLDLAGLDAADGAKGGNVEFEWKVEEGES